MKNLLITNALIVPMTDRKPFLGSVRVRDGAITEVVQGKVDKPSAGERVMDAAGRVLMPGLVNAHTHLYQVLLRAVWEDLPLMPWLKRIYGSAQVLTPEHFYAGSLLGCVESIRGGVTTVCEHNFLNPHPDCGVETLRALRESGMRAVFARTIMNAGEIVPDCTKETPEVAFRRIEDLLEANKKTEQLSFMTGPNTPPINTTADLLKEIRSFADAKRLGISSHVAESSSVVDCVRQMHGKNGVVEYLHQFGITGPNTIFAHSVHLTKEDIRLLAETGTSVSHNPVSNMMLGDGVAPVVEMLAQGVNIGLGSDGAASNHSQDLFDTMKSASLLQKVHHQNAGIIRPYDVLRMATIGGAKALGLSALCGTVEVGKRADLIILDMDTVHNQPINDLYSQIVHCAKASDVRTLMVDGKVLMEERALTGQDEKKVLERARKAHKDLVERLGTLVF
jgi:5-methylthioadenosine/S-adenosylhomocysteine deaminase